MNFKLIKIKLNYAGVLIGNKIDLSLRRSVSVQHAEEFAKSYGFEYFETSAVNINMYINYNDNHYEYLNNILCLYSLIVI